ncbi:hypothetical protein, variant [Phytophthora nicotianae CJ01A1]|uniref:TIL domain-containing protein n=5 Tax=Phytophthora nicotianae TaxID=4792 RepID=W2QFR0_PHYN3|nr:hypothetical protein, variant [Phytophthora nicotianae INRA-310]ETI50881.1 hypothetical protein, variant [Phytophthora nicotianae P1569]ETL97357.1 hypothetical protein, variant [Phytophthora nicotianae]ETP20650.1 hypothetical protein, variant [Phytophthora nicotianae CJ01A1]ETP48588.1 hypothetical protein, variant [Phytophthora nicotianae P10297]ETM50537.1 hypothetical protein, variant [Phytophthora nicotianae]
MQAAIQLLQLLLLALPAVVKAEGCVTKACTLDCQPGETCALQMVDCIRAPCPPIQACVDFQECRIYEPDGSDYCADVCAEGRCPKGSICELQEVQCIRAPCPPMATCNK